MTTMRPIANPMPQLYTRLSGIGLNRKYVQSVVLPSWWEDEIADNPAGYAQALGLVARNLGLDLRSLQKQDGPVLRYDLGPRRFKRQASVTDQDLELAECIALRAAQLACRATPTPVQPLPASAAELRRAILAAGTGGVTFAALLDACWDRGVPVLHIARFPQGAKKMDGIAARIEGRPVIVLSCKRPYAAWQAFHAAHEMGHIGRGHLRADGVLVEDAEQKTREAQEEAEANDFALELLIGDPKLQYVGGKRLSGPALAQQAVTQGQARQIEPGALVLNYAKSTGDWAGASSALKIIEPAPDAVALVHRKMCERLDWDCLSDESQEFLRRVTGADGAA